MTHSFAVLTGIPNCLLRLLYVTCANEQNARKRELAVCTYNVLLNEELFDEIVLDCLGGHWSSAWHVERVAHVKWRQGRRKRDYGDSLGRAVDRWARTLQGE